MSSSASLSKFSIGSSRIFIHDQINLILPRDQSGTTIPALSVIVSPYPGDLKRLPLLSFLF
jgi:hypothetical protein